MSIARALYHRVVPEAVRNPIGLARRSVADSFRRAFSRLPIPPRPLLEQIQLAPWSGEYLEIGRRSAESIVTALEAAGLPANATVLDFGCEVGRTLRHLRNRGWSLCASDFDSVAVAWCDRSFSFARFAVSRPGPPLPWADETFDAVYSVSAFTHLSEAAQEEWRDELARLLKPGGVAAISTIGSDLLASSGFDTPENRGLLSDYGVLFAPGVFARAPGVAFHTPEGIVRLFAPRFELVRWSERGLDGFQDLSLLRRS